jgi:hypothetical protein
METGYCKPKEVARERICSDLARRVGVPVPEMKLGRIEGQADTVGISTAHGSESMDVRHVREKPELFYSVEFQAALRGASGLLPFHAWVGTSDLKEVSSQAWSITSSRTGRHRSRRAKARAAKRRARRSVVPAWRPLRSLLSAIPPNCQRDVVDGEFAVALGNVTKELRGEWIAFYDVGVASADLTGGGAFQIV